MQCTALSCIGFTSPRITWKKEWASQVEYQGIVQACREAIRKAKAQLKLKLVSDLKDEKESFYSTLSAKVKQRKTGACCGAGALVTEKKTKNNILSAFSASAFTNKMCTCTAS